MADTTQAQLDAQIFGDPQGFLASPLSRLMPAHPGSVGPYLNVSVFPDPQTATQQAPWGGAQERGNLETDWFGNRKVTGSDLQHDIDMTDLLYASGLVNAEDSGWKSTVDTGDIPGHAMSSDTYGQQLGVKAALRKEANPLWSSGFTNLLHRGRAIIDPVHQPLLDSKTENTRRAIDAYNEANPQRGFFAPLAAGTIPAGGLTGKALNQWLREGNVLQANTPSGIGPLPKPGDPDFRGITAKDVPKTKFGDYVQDAKRLAKRAGGFLGRTSPLTLGLSAAFDSPDLGDSYVEDLDTLQPFNFGQEHTKTLRSFLPPITFPEGTVAPYQGPLGDPPNREDWFTVPDLSAIGINPNPDYTWQEILGVQSDLPGTVAPARRAFNVDEFGNRASLARFTEPEVDTDDFIRENLIEAVAPAPEKTKVDTRSQPRGRTGTQTTTQRSGATSVESKKDREAREAREQGAREKKKKQEQAKASNKKRIEKAKVDTTTALQKALQNSTAKAPVKKVITSKKNISNAVAAARGDVKSAVTIALTSGDVQRAEARARGVDPSTVYGSTLRRTADGGWAGGF